MTLRTEDNNLYQIMVYNEKPVDNCKSLVKKLKKEKRERQKRR
jgi:hypothetical protein